MKTIKSEHPYHLLTFRGKRQDIIDFLNGGLLQAWENSDRPHVRDLKLIEPEMSTHLMDFVLDVADFRDMRFQSNPFLCFDAFVPYGEIEKLGLPNASDDEDDYQNPGYRFWAWKVEEQGDELEAKAVNFAVQKLDRFVSYLNDKHPQIHVSVEEKGGSGKEVELAPKNVKLSQLYPLIQEFRKQGKKAKPMILLFDSDDLREDIEDDLLASVRNEEWSEHYGLALGEKTDPAYDYSIGYIDKEYSYYDISLLDTWNLSEKTADQRNAGGMLFFCAEEEFFEESVAHIDFIHDYYDVYRVVADTHAEWVEWAKRIDFVPEIIEVVAKHPEWYNSSEEDEDEANEQVLCRELDMLDMFYSILREEIESIEYRTKVLVRKALRSLSSGWFDEAFIQAVKEVFMSIYKEPEELEIIYEDISFCSIDVIRTILRDVPLWILRLPLKDRTEKTKLYLQEDPEMERIYLSFTPNAEEWNLSIQTDCYTVDEDDWRNRGHVGELCIEWTVEDREGNEEDGRSYIASEDMIASAVETFDNIVKNSAK